MRMMQGNFRIWISKLFEKEADGEGNEEEDLLSTKRAVEIMLKTVRTLTSIATSVRWLLARDEPIKWNNIPCYTVFPNCVLQLNKRCAAYPYLYFFGKTRPDEYMNDEYCMQFAFNCPPVCWDGHYIKQAEDLLDDWLIKVQPIAEDRYVLLVFLSLILKAFNYKKIVLNICQTGDNAKSSCFEMVVFLAGSYGLVGDKHLIVKGRKDRVSQAEVSRRRFVLFEEPDPSKQLDVEAIKDMVGGSKKGKGRYNFSNNNDVLLHCKTVLNANTMTSVQLEAAIFKRLLFLAWLTQFVTKKSFVNEDKRIYLADEKYKTEEYWESINDGFIWLLLNHFRLFAHNDMKLKISDRQLQITKAQLLDNDLFINWFKENFIFLKATEEQKKLFVTHEEISDAFCNLRPQRLAHIVGRKNYDATKYVKDMLQAHVCFKSCYKNKVTNWRISKDDRLAASKNSSGQFGRYRRHVLITFIKRAEYQADPGRYVKEDLAYDAEADAKMQEANKSAYRGDDESDDGDNDSDDGAEVDVDDDYLHSNGLFFYHRFVSAVVGPYKLSTDKESWNIFKASGTMNYAANDNDKAVIKHQRTRSIINAGVDSAIARKIVPLSWQNQFTASPNVRVPLIPGPEDGNKLLNPDLCMDMRGRFSNRGNVHFPEREDGFSNISSRLHRSNIPNRYVHFHEPEDGATRYVYGADRSQVVIPKSKL